MPATFPSPPNKGGRIISTSSNSPKAQSRLWLKWTNALPWIFLGSFFLIPLLFLTYGVWVLNNPPKPLTEKTSPVFVDVEADYFQNAASVELKLTWTNGPSISSPGWDGIITEVAPISNGQIDSGAKVVRINGAWKIAAATPIPFFRQLSQGAKGQDVAALNAFLESLGLPSKSGDTWSGNTADGVMSLTKLLNVSLGDGPTVFEPNWVMWLPSNPFIVEGSKLQVGQPAPAQGTPILEAPKILQSVSMDDPTNKLSTSVQGKSSIRVGDSSFEYSGKPGSPIKDQGALATSISGNPDSVPATIEFVSIEKGHTVPVSSLVTDGTGKNCVYTPSSGDQWQPRLVQVAGGEVGKVTVSGLGSDRIQVLVNPRESLAARKCS